MTTLLSRDRASIGLGDDRQARWAAVVVLGVLLACYVGVQTPLRPLVPLALPLVLALVAGLSVRRWPAGCLALIVGLWLTVAEARRISDWGNFYQPNSVWLICPALASVIALAACAGRRVKLPRSLVVRSLFAAYALSISLAFAVGVVRNGLSGALAGAFVWGGPLLFAVLVIALGAGRTTYEALVKNIFLPWLLVAGVYGIYQYYVLPEWDAAWMNNVNPALTSIGFAEPQEFRVYSISNAPGVFSAVVAALVLACSPFIARRPWTVVLLLPSLVGLALSLVRASWIVLVLVLALALALRLLRVRSIVFFLALGLAGISLIPPETMAVVSERFDTLGEGAQDDSLSARISFHQEALPIILADPVGGGLGSSGSANRYSGQSAPGVGFANRENFDGGFLEVFFTVGAVMGAPLLSLMLLRVIELLWRPRARPVSSWAGLAMLSLFAQLFFGNTVTGVLGVLTAVFAFMATGGSDVSSPQMTAPGDSALRRSGAHPYRAQDL